MYSAPIPANDDARVAALRSYGVLDTAPQPEYDDITFLASYICETPYSTITLVDRDRQWFKSERGFGTRETNRQDGFCACAVLDPNIMLVGDTRLDPRFAANPFVTGGPQLCFYAGAPLITPDGHIIGTVCVFDDRPRELRPDQLRALQALAHQVMARMELDRKAHETAQAAEGLRVAEKLAAVGRMASAVAHEINNPLQSVTNLLFMVETTEAREPRQEYLRMAQDELSRVSQIVTQSLRFHRQSIAAAPARLGELAETVLLLYRTRLSHASAHVHLRDSQTKELTCFADDVRHALSNLVSNALDGLQVSGGGDLFVRVYDGTVEGVPGVFVTVADSGSGIRPEIMARLFQPFNTTKGIRGTGLGLWVTKGIWDKHGAQVWVRSRVGVGTAVRTFFPNHPQFADVDTVSRRLPVN